MTENLGRKAPKKVSKIATVDGFPAYGEGPAKGYLDELVRLLSPSIFATQYMDAPSAAKLLVTLLRTYAASKGNPRWNTSSVLQDLATRGGGKRQFNLVCAAFFDLLCNAEYIRGRMVTSNWIYCSRTEKDGTRSYHAYYSFLKQCPTCCLDAGLGPRLEKAQHKPGSHHIGEITTTATAFFLTLLGQAAKKPLTVQVVSKQSHDVDAAAWRDDLLVLFEIKASPLVTYPLRTKLSGPFTESNDDGQPVEIKQHSLVSVQFAEQELSLFLANRNLDVPLGKPGQGNNAWPFPALTSHMSNVDGLLDYLEAWAEIFCSYSIPKTERKGDQVNFAYLANGWGDEIDSNKTKAGLGRTDDIKKGTYQLLKFGAYYRDGSPNLPIRGTLVANLDPVFLHKEYLARLIDGRWAPDKKFRAALGKTDVKEIDEKDLFYIYDGLLAFNHPVMNDPILKDCFSFEALEEALFASQLETIFQSWESK